jgi:hypothetical protein
MSEGTTAPGIPTSLRRRPVTKGVSAPRNDMTEGLT